MSHRPQKALIQDLATKISAIESSTQSAFGLSASETSSTQDSESSKVSSKELDEAQAYQKIVRMASVREHSTTTIRQRLTREGYPAPIIDQALARACAHSVIDDHRYADCLIRQRLASGKGMQPVWREIEELGINPETLDAYEEYEQATLSEIDRACAFLDRHPTRSKNLYQGSYRKLVAQGFSPSVAADAARRWSNRSASYT